MNTRINVLELITATHQAINGGTPMGYYDTQLYHHGIPGQKWGDRNGPPYPLDDKEHDQVVERKEKKGLTDEQKKALIIGASITAGLIAGYGAYRLYEINKFNKSDFGDLGYMLKNKTYSADEDMKAVNGSRLLNPFKNLNGQYSHNCVLCSATYDLRRRGYDVKAGEETIGKTWNDVAKIYGLSEKELMDRIKSFDRSKGSYENIVNAVKEYGDGTRGSLHIQYSPILGGGYHSIVWENDRGQPILRDCQSGKKYKGKQIQDLLNICDADSIIRTDDLKVDAKQLYGVARNATQNDGGLSEMAGLMKTTALSSLAGGGSYAVTRQIQEGGFNNGKQRGSNTINKASSTQNGTYYKRD